MIVNDVQCPLSCLFPGMIALGLLQGQTWQGLLGGGVLLGGRVSALPDDGRWYLYLIDRAASRGAPSRAHSTHSDLELLLGTHPPWHPACHPGSQQLLSLFSGSPPTKRQRRSRGRPSGGARRRRRGAPANPQQQQEPARPTSEGKVTCGMCPWVLGMHV